MAAFTHSSVAGLFATAIKRRMFVPLYKSHIACRKSSIVTFLSLTKENVNFFVLQFNIVKFGVKIWWRFDQISRTSFHLQMSKVILEWLQARWPTIYMFYVIGSWTLKKKKINYNGSTQASLPNFMCLCDTGWGKLFFLYLWQVVKLCCHAPYTHKKMIFFSQFCVFFYFNWVPSAQSTKFNKFGSNRNG